MLVLITLRNKLKLMPCANSHVTSVRHLIVQGIRHARARVSLFPSPQLHITPLRLMFYPGIADFKLSGVPPQPPKLPHPADALNIFRALFLDVLALHSRPLADVHAQELAGLLFQQL